MLSGQWSPSQECEIGNEECFGAATVPTRTCSYILSARFIGKGCKLGHIFMQGITNSFTFMQLPNIQYTIYNTNG